MADKNTPPEANQNLSPTLREVYKQLGITEGTDPIEVNRLLDEYIAKEGFKAFDKRYPGDRGLAALYDKEL